MECEDTVPTALKRARCRQTMNPEWEKIKRGRIVKRNSFKDPKLQMKLGQMRQLLDYNPNEVFQKRDIPTIPEETVTTCNSTIPYQIEASDFEQMSNFRFSNKSPEFRSKVYSLQLTIRRLQLLSSGQEKLRKTTLQQPVPDETIKQFQNCSISDHLGTSVSSAEVMSDNPEHLAQMRQTTAEETMEQFRNCCISKKLV